MRITHGDGANKNQQDVADRSKDTSVEPDLLQPSFVGRRIGQRYFNNLTRRWQLWDGSQWRDLVREGGSRTLRPIEHTDETDETDEDE